jgi:hypothetical protein
MFQTGVEILKRRTNLLTQFFPLRVIINHGYYFRPFITAGTGALME